MEENRFNEISQLREDFFNEKISVDEYKKQVSEEDHIEWSLESGRRLAKKGEYFNNI